MKRYWFDGSLGMSEKARKYMAEASVCKDESSDDDDGENKNIGTMSG